MTKVSQSTHLKNIEKKQAIFKRAEDSIKTVILGQDTVIRLSLTTLISGGHFILLGVPGLAKTKLVQTLGTVLGLDQKRIQCTPDLMPADILGSEILQSDKNGASSFSFIKGPVFCQFLMADEINRASPRTQSALLEAMQEKQVTVSGESHALPKPFHVMATQNPIEQEGTYPLPEAQLDRFLMQIKIDYPSQDAERAMLIQTTSNTEISVKKILSDKDILETQTLIRDMPIGEKLVDQILYIVQNLRPETSNNQMAKDYLSWGAGPRAGQALMLAVRAHAFLDNRTAPMLEDLLAVASPVLRHRLGLHFSTIGKNITADGIIQNVCDSL